MQTENRFLFYSASMVTLGAAALFCYLAFIAGQDSNWDFYNYHYYNAFAWFNDRFWYDIQPAQRQTFFSPFLDIPFFWLTQQWGILTASLLYAAFQSLQAPALYILSYSLVRDAGFGRFPAMGAAVVFAAIGLLAPLNYQEVGTVCGDSTTATLVIWGLALFFLACSKSLPTPPHQRQNLLIASAGLLLGLAFGLKLTNGIYVMALGGCILLLQSPWHLKLRILVIFGFAAGAALLFSYGYWGWFLYNELQNPFFPQFNHIFQSGYTKPVAYTDKAYQGTSLPEIIFYPFYFNTLTGKINGQQFLDIRIPITYLLITVTAITSLFPRLISRLTKKTQDKLKLNWQHPQMGLLIFFSMAFVLWLVLFSITRYALVLEVLTPLVAFSAVSLWSQRQWLVSILAVTALIPMAIYVILLPLNGAFLGPRVPWTDTPFEVSFPSEYDRKLEDAMVLVSGGQAMAFIIPTAPTSTRFVRIDSNLFYVRFRSLQERYATGMGQKITHAIEGHPGQFFSLFADGEQAQADKELAVFALYRQQEHCQPIRNKPNLALIICPVQRPTTALPTENNN